VFRSLRGTAQVGVCGVKAAAWTSDVAATWVMAAGGPVAIFGDATVCAAARVRVPVIKPPVDPPLIDVAAGP